ncbi:kinase-like domain-containing protein [Mycena olivaceomarginata]|nr:kinase-like domain-containing protein [Mycena olivaceomarginata]
MLPDAVASVGRLGATLVYGVLVALCHMRLAYLCRQEVQVPAIADDWAMLGRDEAKAVWFACSAFLHQYGIILFGDPRYDLVPAAPRDPARNAFQPNDAEDFVHRVPKSPRRLRNMTFWMPTGHVGVDARGRNIFIKAVRASSEEWRIIKYLSTGANRRNSWNRTIPQVSFIPANEWIFIVQAYWGSLWDCPPWDSIPTRLILARQLIEGLCFMHMHGIAHCDLHPGNVVCNHEDLHPPHTRWPPGTTQPAFQSTFNFQLAFIDFEAATRFPTQAQSHVGKLESAPPSPFSAPECQPACEESETEECATQECETVEYDMFAADVYSLGQILLHELEAASETLPPVETQLVVPEYAALIEHMTAREPGDRPTAPEALELVIAAYIKFGRGHIPISGHLFRERVVSRYRCCDRS